MAAARRNRVFETLSLTYARSWAGGTEPSSVSKTRSICSSPFNSAIKPSLPSFGAVFHERESQRATLASLLSGPENEPIRIAYSYLRQMEEAPKG